MVRLQRGRSGQAIVALLAIALAGCAGATATPAPAAAPTAAPTTAPTGAPTAASTAAPTSAPTVAPTIAPTVTPTVAPSATPAPPLTSMTTVRFASWGPPTSDTSFFWVGVEKGFFKDENIDFQWVAGNGTADAARHVIAGDAQFAWSSADAAMFAAEQGAKLKQIFAFWGDIYELVYLPDVCKCTIGSVKDLAGKKVGVQSQSSITRFILLKELADNSMKESDFAEEINVGFNPAPPLTGAQIDTYTSWPNLTLFLKSLPGMEKLVATHITEGGVPDGIVVSQDTWDNNQSLVQAFYRAFLKSVEYEIAHPEEVAGFLHTYLTGDTQTPEQLLPQIKNNDIQLAGPGTTEHGLGYMDIAAIKAAGDVLLAAGLIKQPADPDAIFTNTLVEQYKGYGR